MKARIQVDPDSVVGRITRHLTGACLEDVNHEVYGGLYSQMVFGESFEEEPMLIDARLDPAFDGLSGTVSCLAERQHLAQESAIRSWQPFRQGDAQGSFALQSTHSRRGRHCQGIRFVSGDGEVGSGDGEVGSGDGEIGIENRGLNRWGMSFVAGKPYEGTVVLRAIPHSQDATEGVEVIAALASADGGEVYARTAIQVPSDHKWHVIDFELTPTKSDAEGRFELKLTAPGSVSVDYAALHPGEWGRFEGLYVRRDIAERLKEQGLTVLRYGGFMINTRQLEARHVGPVYRWKQMIGPRPDRPPYWGTFYRYNSNGFGMIDFVAFCKAAGFLAVPTISSLESPQDIADLVEYLNGNADTEWGRRRVEDGYPEPFGVQYIAIGNEEWDWDYVEEFKALSDAIAKADPEITSIVAMWLTNESMAGADTSKALDRLVEHSRGKKVLWDLHIGGDGLRDGDEAEALFHNARQFLDQSDPENEILFCVLEENGGRHDVQRALGHAHIINTVERLGDQVLIDCPANCLQPWKQNDNDWDQGQVFFTPTQVWGQPPYYAQQMIARNYLPVCIGVEADHEALDVTATRSEDGRVVVLKVVNLGSEDVSAAVTFADPGFRAARIRIECLSGDLAADNPPDDPEKVRPSGAVVEPPAGAVEQAFPAYSFTVLRFECD